MNIPLKYNNETLGYLKDYILDDNGNIEMLKFLIYDSSWYDKIFYDDLMENIKKSLAVTFDKNIDKTVMENNTLYQFNLIDDGERYLIIKII